MAASTLAYNILLGKQPRLQFWPQAYTITEDTALDPANQQTAITPTSTTTNNATTNPAPAAAVEDPDLSPLHPADPPLPPSPPWPSWLPDPQLVNAVSPEQEN